MSGELNVFSSLLINLIKSPYVNYSVHYRLRLRNISSAQLSLCWLVKINFSTEITLPLDKMSQPQSDILSRTKSLPCGHQSSCYRLKSRIASTLSDDIPEHDRDLPPGGLNPTLYQDRSLHQQLHRPCGVLSLSHHWLDGASSCHLIVSNIKMREIPREFHGAGLYIR